jgi:hypothetical protein
MFRVRAALGRKVVRTSWTRLLRGWDAVGMLTRRAMLTGLVATGVLVGTGSQVSTAQSASHAPRHCVAGARTLSTYGDHVYPDTGNGGYRSLHTDVHMVYDATTNTFLRGNHVDLTVRATRCLKNFSLDFERRSPFAGGPDLHVTSIHVNRRPARFAFVRPTYPGDPHGVNDPDPRAHEASQHAVVGGPHHNPLPPACSPELPATARPNSRNGTLCPKNKLVITPAHHLRAGTRFTVTVAYTGHPGVHQDGDGTTEGWFRSNHPAGDGGFVTTEPVGTEDWMPVNDHPSAKPTYDFYDRVTAGRTVLANGILISEHRHRATGEFPHGSTTWHWHMAYPVASYLVENSVGHYDLTRFTAANGIHFYTAQASSLSAARKAANLKIMRRQPDITEFQSQFNGAYPFASAGVVVGRPSASFEEEMEGMITFAGGSIDADTFNHENMHQWWGDNVSEDNYNDTFFKEGFATLGEFLFHARRAAVAAGGLHTRAGAAAFNRSLVREFDAYYASTRLWQGAPSNPTPYSLFSGASTYVRPGIAYIALRQILGSTNFTRTLQAVQRRYAGATISERQLEAAFHRGLPNRGAACSIRLDRFFRQWFDTSYPTKSGAGKPSITGPGLAGGGFYGARHTCS